MFILYANTLKVNIFMCNITVCYLILHCIASSALILHDIMHTSLYHHFIQLFDAHLQYWFLPLPKIQ